MTSIEGDLRILENFPRDALGNDIHFIGVSFLHARPGLQRLNAYVAATFLSGEYDDSVFTLNMDRSELETIIREFRLHPIPYIERALAWLILKSVPGVVPTVRYSVE